MSPDPTVISAIAHRYHTYCSPVNPLRVKDLIELLRLPREARVLDAGCGKGELLIHIAERYRVMGVGFDLAVRLINAGRRRAMQVTPELVDLRVGDVRKYEVTPESLALAICVGSTHIYGDFCATLHALRALVQPGGYVLAGDSFWARDPAPELLEHLGVTQDVYTDYAGLVKCGIDHNLIPLYCATSSPADWEHYEWLYVYALERYAAEHPDDPLCHAVQAQACRVRDRYLRWGRETFGFALCLFQRDA
ncbi:MAG: class I SAM-dependent methyltransferase [Anaerolineae bacterium]|nr:class I SAM-dependent methyltransferase [Anaerolineae bacterium]